MPQQVGEREERCRRIREVFARDVRCRSTRGVEHGDRDVTLMVEGIGGAVAEPDRADESAGRVREEVSILIGTDDHAVAIWVHDDPREQRVEELSAVRDPRIVLRDAVADLFEEAVRDLLDGPLARRDDAGLALHRELEREARSVTARVTTDDAQADDYNRRLLDNPLTAEHPLVTVHPETGERVLYTSQEFTSHIVGLEPRESDALLEFLWEHCIRAEFCVRFSWKPGSIAFWDNRATQHQAIRDVYASDFEREFYRVTLNGEIPTGVDGKSSTHISGQPITAI